MELSEVQKRKIEAEELYQLQIEDRVTRNFQKSKGLGCSSCIVTLLIIATLGIISVGILSAINLTSL